MGRARAFLLLAALAWPASVAAEPVAAAYAEPTDRYPHAVLGDDLEWAALTVTLADGRVLTYRIPDESVFEDIAPRLADIDGDGENEAWVIRADATDGARLEAYAVIDGALRLKYAGPPVGLGFRWLNPVGVADFDGDGGKEAAYVETPHIGGILKILKPVGDKLRIVATAYSYSTHKIGSTALDLAAMIDLDRDGAVDILLPSQTHDRLILVSMQDGKIVERWRSAPLAPIGGGLTVVQGGAGLEARYRDRAGAPAVVALPAPAALR